MPKNEKPKPEKPKASPAEKRKKLLQSRLARADGTYPPDTRRVFRLELVAIKNGAWMPGWQPPPGMKAAERKAFDRIVGE